MLHVLGSLGTLIFEKLVGSHLRERLVCLHFWEVGIFEAPWHVRIFGKTCFFCSFGIPGQLGCFSIGPGSLENIGTFASLGRAAMTGCWDFVFAHC